MANQVHGYDASTLGRSGGSIGFYGATGTTIQSVTSNVTIAFSEAKTGMWAFQNSTRAAQFVTQVQDRDWETDLPLYFSF